jgi:hypothetical protein
MHLLARATLRHHLSPYVHLVSHALERGLTDDGAQRHLLAAREAPPVLRRELEEVRRVHKSDVARGGKGLDRADIVVAIERGELLDGHVLRLRWRRQSESVCVGLALARRAAHWSLATATANSAAPREQLERADVCNLLAGERPKVTLPTLYNFWELSGSPYMWLSQIEKLSRVANHFSSKPAHIDAP